MVPPVRGDVVGELVVELPLYRLALLVRAKTGQAGAGFLAAG
jgi:hypothetical protein